MKNEKGNLWRQKTFQKKSHSAKKSPKGDPLGTSGFVCFLEKVKNERGDPMDLVCKFGALRWFQDCF